MPATCCAGGAKKWRAEHSEYLRGADIVLVPDNDDAGWEHINQVGAALNGIAARIRVLALPDLPPKGDVDRLARGWRHTRAARRLGRAGAGLAAAAGSADRQRDKAKAAADEQKLIDELARLNAVDYDRRRNEAADQMGIRRGTLDDAGRRAPRRAGRGSRAAAAIWSLGGRAVAGSRRHRRADCLLWSSASSGMSSSAMTRR